MEVYVHIKHNIRMQVSTSEPNITFAKNWTHKIKNSEIALTKQKKLKKKNTLFREKNNDSHALVVENLLKIFSLQLLPCKAAGFLFN